MAAAVQLTNDTFIWLQQEVDLTGQAGPLGPGPSGPSGRSSTGHRHRSPGQTATLKTAGRGLVPATASTRSP